MKYDIFKSQFLHFSANDIQRSIDPERWLRYGSRALVVMVPCASVQEFRSRMKRSSAFIGIATNYFLKPSGEAYCVVSLITMGVIRRDGSGAWHIRAYPEGLNIKYSIPPEADVGLAPLPVSLDLMPQLVEEYVRKHRHTLTQGELFPA